ncbi:hypothetical protein GCM10022206_13010 [Streptomyces chiangmaiensis]
MTTRPTAGTKLKTSHTTTPSPARPKEPGPTRADNRAARGPGRDPRRPPPPGQSPTPPNAPHTATPHTAPHAASPTPAPAPAAQKTP